MWIFWALLSAVLVAIRRPFEKNAIKDIDHFTFGFLVQSISLPIILAIVILNKKLLNPMQLGLGFWIPVITSIGYYPLSAYLYKKAMKDSELSKVLPLQSLWPVFGLILAWPTLGQVPTLVSSAGVILTVIGIYALGLKGKQLHHPLKPFMEDKNSRAMLQNVILVTFASILDKIAIRASNPLFYSLASTIGAIITLSFAMKITKQKLRTISFPQFKKLGIIGTLQGTTYVTYLLALSSGPIAYVSALRSTNILMGSIIGIIIFRERLTKPKIVSFFLITVGALLLTFGSPK
jgi:uncharacterized membrane protein